MKFSTLLSSLSAASTLFGGSWALEKGFNFGALNPDGSCATYWDFHERFRRMQQLGGAPGFVSARLYTSIQCGSVNAPIEAIKAAIDTKTDLTLGIWASAGQSVVTNEIIAIKDAARRWPVMVKRRVRAISVGSEDLYRSSPQGVANKAGVGASADQIVMYMQQLRTALRGTVLEGKIVGHVDTWTAWILPENRKVISASNFLGHNSFPYFETTKPNSIDRARENFEFAVRQTESVAMGKPVWVTETGWPWKGPVSGQAVASTANAKRYWNEVGCGQLFGKRNVFWYTMYSANAAQTNMDFSVVKPVWSQGQVFPLWCPA